MAAYAALPGANGRVGQAKSAMHKALQQQLADWEARRLSLKVELRVALIVTACCLLLVAWCLLLGWLVGGLHSD